MASPGERLEENFLEAASNWNLEKLYVDLAVAKGRGLTPVEKKFLRGLLCGYSPAEIAAQVYKSGSSSAVRVYLSNGLYKYIQDLLVQQGETGLPIKNWSRVTNLLERAGYKLQPNQRLSAIENHPKPGRNGKETSTPLGKYQEWQEALEVASFYGRQTELAQLQQWFTKEGCRLVAILGMGGIGKTALVLKLAEQIQSQFEVLIWRTLKSSPLLANVLDELIVSLSEARDPDLPLTVAGKISRLMTYLRSRRCLLVLDQVETVLRPQTLAGRYREGYEDYGQLFSRLGDERHQSCCVLTSREKPREIAAMAGAKLPVRTLVLSGLRTDEGIKLLQLKGQRAVKEHKEQQLLVSLYANNPLVLKLVATTIQDVFDGDITEFLTAGTLIFGDVRELFEQQFQRLCDLEQQVMCELAMQPCSLTLAGWTQLAPGISKREWLEVLESLQRRCLIQKETFIENGSTGFTQQPIVRAYVTQKLVEQMTQALTTQNPAFVGGRRFLEQLLRTDLSERATASNVTSQLNRPAASNPAGI